MALQVVYKGAYSRLDQFYFKYQTLFYTVNLNFVLLIREKISVII